MTEENKKQENPEAEIKKLLQAHMLVLKDKLGRVPTSEEIAEALKGGESQEAGQPLDQAISETPENSAEPKILKLKVYYGQGSKKTDKGVVKSPDPNKILFYEGHDGRTYDCENQSWMSQRPSVLDHLPSRPLLFDSKNSDIIQAILNGVIDDEDFSELDKSGAVNENTKKIYALQKKACEIKQQLEKSEEIEIDDENNESEQEDEYPVIEQGTNAISVRNRTKTGTDIVKGYFDTAGVQMGMDAVRDEFGERGVDLFTQIMQAALADVDEKTRMLVREEMDECLAPVLDIVQLLAEKMGISVDLNSDDDEEYTDGVDFNEGYENYSDEELTPENAFDNIEDES